MFDIDSFDLRMRAVPDGGVTSARGFKAAGIHAGFRKNPERLDFAMVAAEAPVAAAGVFTTNRFCAAPVQVCREHLGGRDCGYGQVQGVIINSGNANAATGEPGLALARESCEIASQIMCSYSFVNWEMLSARLNRGMLTPGHSAGGLQSARCASARRRKAPCPA